MGPLKKDPHGRGGMGEGDGGRGVICNVLRGSEALGGSICCVLKGLRLSGGRMSNEAVVEGGSAKERPSRAWGGRGRGELGSYEFK